MQTANIATAPRRRHRRHGATGAATGLCGRWIPSHSGTDRDCQRHSRHKYWGRCWDKSRHHLRPCHGRRMPIAKPPRSRMDLTK